MSKIGLPCGLVLLFLLLIGCTSPDRSPEIAAITVTSTSLSPTTTPALPPSTATPVPSAAPFMPTLEDFVGPSFAAPIQRYLDSGGDPDALEAVLNAIIADPDQGASIRAQVDHVDVTGDDVDEVMVTLTIPRDGRYVDTGLLVLTPKAEHYEILLELVKAPLETLTDVDGYRFLAVVDMNHSGTKELVIDLAVGNDHRFWILGWDGSRLRSLLAPQRDPLTSETVDYIYIPNGTGIVRDVNGDGLLDLYTIRYRPEGEGPRHCGAKDVWSWDGTVFRHVHRIL